jgi:hypothetical protein
MAIAVTVVSPDVESEITPVAALVTDVEGGEAWIAAQYDSSAAIEVVHDGDSFMPRFASSSVTPITGGARYTIRRTGGWPRGVVGLRYYEELGAGAVTPPFVDKTINSNDSGDECVALQLPFDADTCPAVIAAKLAIVAGSSAGTAVLRAYIGGSRFSVDDVYTGGGTGTLVGSVNVSSVLGLVRILGDAIANPGGLQLLTVTYESSAPGQSVTTFGLTGFVA